MTSRPPMNSRNKSTPRHARPAAGAAFCPAGAADWVISAHVPLQSLVLRMNLIPCRSEKEKLGFLIETIAEILAIDVITLKLYGRPRGLQYKFKIVLLRE